jgi:hypothetical protein
MESEMSSGDSTYKPPSKPTRSSRGFPTGWVITAVVILIACIVALFVFAGASVKITPTVNETTVSDTWSATPSTGDLPFEVVTVDHTAVEEVPAEGTETANIPAQGTITIYNGQDKVQELIKNTRFESPDGKIYRIQASIKVPAGTSTAPGTLKATVYADAAGDSYNIGPSTFTLPGLASSPLFDLVYAKSNEPITGGFTGTRPSISQGARTAEYEKMRPALEAQLQTAVKEKIPEGYVLLSGAATYAYTELPDAEATSSSVQIQYKGTATAFIFQNQALARALAYRLVAKFNGQPVTLAKTEGLTLTPSGEEPPSAGMQNFTFNLNGSATIIWNIDPAQISEAIAGKSRDSARTILKGFPEIGDASIVLRPFWSGTLPENPTEIEIEVREPEMSK